MRTKKPDRFFFLVILAISVLGFFVFSSASLGLLGREGASYSLIAVKQLAILLVGLFLMIACSHVPAAFWRKWSWLIILMATLLTLLVFLPKIGFGYGGARRWLNFGLFSFQPSELFKLAFIIFLAAWFATIKDKVRSFRYGFLPFLLMLSVAGAILLAQPDTGTFMTLAVASVATFLVAGGKWSHFFLMILLAVLVVGTLAIYRPYIRDRITTFFNPKEDVLNSSYQINQSLIAIGSGGISGRGFGQSIQKYSFLPEPMGDSIFAVAAEEFGFIGSVIIIIFLLILTAWGLKIASRQTDVFSRLLVVGIVILMAAQAFINISAMLGLIPLTGVPLIFISQGGSALLITLLAAGIVLNVSRT